MTQLQSLESDKTMTKGAIIQSNYIPWKGYFDIIHDVDVFIFLDNVQFTVRDWRNRNQIKTPRGKVWLTVPVGNNRNRLIENVEIPQPQWQLKHYRSLVRNYQKAPYFGHIEPLLEAFYLQQVWRNLSRANQFVIEEICRRFLGIKTIFMNASDMKNMGQKTERILSLCEQAGVSHYLTGPAARVYIDPDKFAQAGIVLEYKDYSGYPAYQQLYPPFDHHVSIVDLLAHTGPEAPYSIWGWRE